MSREMLRDAINELIETERTFVSNMETFVKLIKYASYNSSARKEINKALEPYEMLSQPNLLSELEPLKPDCSDNDIVDMLNSIHYALTPSSIQTHHKNKAFNQAAEEMVKSLDFLQTHFVGNNNKPSTWQRMVTRTQDNQQKVFARVYNSFKADHNLPLNAPGVDKIIFNFMIQTVQRTPRYVMLIDEIKKNAETLSVVDKNTLEQTSKFVESLASNVDKAAPAPSVAPKRSVAASTPPVVAPTVAVAAPEEAEPAPAVSRPPEFPPAPLPTKIAPRRAESPTNGAGLFDQSAEKVEDRAEAENDKELEAMIEILFALNNANMKLCAALKIPVPAAQQEVNEYCQQLHTEVEKQTATVRKGP